MCAVCDITHLLEGSCNKNWWYSLALNGVKFYLRPHPDKRKRDLISWHVTASKYFISLFDVCKNEINKKLYIYTTLTWFKPPSLNFLFFGFWFLIFAGNWKRSEKVQTRQKLDMVCLYEEFCILRDSVAGMCMFQEIPSVLLLNLLLSVF